VPLPSVSRPLESTDGPATSVRAVALVAVAGLSVVLTAVFLWGTTIPLGVPGEWTWSRIPADPLLPFSIAQLAIAATVFVCVGWLGDRRMADARPRELALWGLAASVAALGWSATLISLTPSPQNAGRATWVLYYPGPSGYYTEARSTDAPWEYLARYDEKVAEGDVLHLGTHPPGLIIAYWLLDSIRTVVPGVEALLEATWPSDAQEWWNLIREQTANTPRPPPAGDGRLLWFAALTVWLVGLSTAWPVWWLVRRLHGPQAAWRTALCWPAVPAIAIFWPKSDGLLPAIGMLVIVLYLSAWEHRSLVRGGVAGLLAFVGVMLTLGLLPTLFWLGVWTLVRWVEPIAFPSHPDGSDPRNQPLATNASSVTRRLPLTETLSAAVPAAGLFLLATLGVSLVCRLNLPLVCLGNLRNHAGFYDQYPRTWLAWLAVNPVELAFALGLPLAVLLGWRLFESFLAMRSAETVSTTDAAETATRSNRRAVLVATVVTFGVLWLSGKNSGEAARLWQFLLPWWLVLSAGMWRAETQRGLWLGVWIAQLVACTVTAWRVAGFDVAG
jgi:methylthioxylose transferase